MNTKKQYKGAIFDLDGTLLDSLGIWREVDRKFLEDRGIPMPSDYSEAVSTKTFRQAAEYTIERFHLQEEPDDLVNIWLSMVVDAYAHQVTLKIGAEQFLHDLKNRGVKIAAATSSMPEAFEACLKHNQVYDLFDVIVTTDMVTRPKGFPDVYELAAQGLGCLAEECIVYEDILLGIRGANLGNFTSCAVYDENNISSMEVIRQEADIYIDSFEDFFNGNVIHPYL